MAHAGELKTLVVGPAWVGDMVMAHTLIQRLAQDAEREIHVLAPRATAPIASRMAEVSKVIEAPFEHHRLGLSTRYVLGKALRDEAYGAAFVLPNSWKSALVPFFARVPRRVGWLGESRFGLLNDHSKLDEDATPLMIERFMALADDARRLPDKPYPLPALASDRNRGLALAQEFGADPENVIGFAPGAAYGPAKQWPAEHFAQLALQLIDEGRRIWLFGSAADVADCETIAAVGPKVVNLAGRTSLHDAIDLMALTRAMVCNDSGLMHIACALSVPTVGVFGSTSPGFTPPLGPDAKSVGLDLECRPCFERTCPLGHLNCLRQLPPERVRAALVA